MVLTPNDLFSWNNKYSKYTTILLHYIHQQWVHFPSSSRARQLTLCMLAFWSCEGVVFLVLLSSSHLTTYHVPPLPLSGANWRSLSLLRGSGSPLPRWRPYSQGPHTLPFQGPRHLILAKFKYIERNHPKEYILRWPLSSKTVTYFTHWLDFYEDDMSPWFCLVSTFNGPNLFLFNHISLPGKCNLVLWDGSKARNCSPKTNCVRLAILPMRW